MSKYEKPVIVKVAKDYYDKLTSRDPNRGAAKVPSLTRRKPRPFTGRRVLCKGGHAPLEAREYYAYKVLPISFMFEMGGGVIGPCALVKVKPNAVAGFNVKYTIPYDDRWLTPTNVTHRNLLRDNTPNILEQYDIEFTVGFSDVFKCPTVEFEPEPDLVQCYYIAFSVAKGVHYFGKVNGRFTAINQVVIERNTDVYTEDELRQKIMLNGGVIHPEDAVVMRETTRKSAYHFCERNNMTRNSHRTLRPMLITRDIKKDGTITTELYYPDNLIGIFRIRKPWSTQWKRFFIYHKGLYNPWLIKDLGLI